jgi:hypothetical protein
MKIRTITVCMVFMGLALALAAVSGYSQDDITMVRDSAFGMRMRAPVKFEHDAHNETAQIEDCTTCHHSSDNDGKKSEDESSEGMECSECHTLKNKNNPMPLAKYYHLQCGGCHQKKKAGPIMCGECHQK